MPTTPTKEYDAFGLRVVSAVPLPGVPRVGSGRAGERPPDVLVEQATLPGSPDALTGASEVYRSEDGRLTAYRTDERYHWFHAGVGSLAVIDGRRIETDTVGDGDPETLGELVAGPGLCSALVQRGLLVLHASVVRVNGTTVAFLGRSGQGKSTSAGACYAAGHCVVADDFAAVAVGDPGGRVVASYPRLRLPTDAAARLDLASEGRPATGGKLAIDVSGGFSRGRHPLDVVYVVRDGDRFETDRLSGHAAVFELLQGSYSLYSATDGSQQAASMEACRSLAEGCAVRRLARPRTLDRLDELVDSSRLPL